MHLHAFGGTPCLRGAWGATVLSLAAELVNVDSMIGQAGWHPYKGQHYCPVHLLGYRFESAGFLVQASDISATLALMVLHKYFTSN